MKITVYSTKGSAWKTPIATNIALDREYAIWTNEPYHVFDGFIPDNRLISLDLNDAFPEIPDNIDIVFDLAGSISNSSSSILTAISQSDVVIVPIYNEVKSIHAWINTISEVLQFNKNVFVIATKLRKKGKNDIFRNWKDSADCLNITKMIKAKFGDKIPVFPLKYSEIFDTIFEKEKSISQIMQESGLNKYLYKEVSKQFDKIYKIIDFYAK